MIERLLRMFRRTEHRDPALAAGAAKEREFIDRLSRISGLSQEQVRAEARRRALRYEVQSLRRHR